MKTRARVVIAAVLGVVVFVVVGVAALTLMRDGDSVYNCADVGLVGPPPGTTPAEALAAFVARKGGDGSDWAAVGDDDFKPRHARELLGFERLSVREVQPGTWQVVGGCVGR